MTNANRVKRRLQELTGSISGAIDSAGNDEAVAYEFSTSYSEPKEKMLEGKWEVVEHTVDGEAYAEAFAKRTFGEGAANVVYEAEYDFTGCICVKRVVIHGTIDAVDGRLECEYRMSVALARELNGDILSVRPLIGYQYTIVDGRTAAVRDLPEAGEWIKIKISFDEGFLTLTDGTDIKKLGRTGG
jgi:hypothetical protein